MTTFWLFDRSHNRQSIVRSRGRLRSTKPERGAKPRARPPLLRAKGRANGTRGCAVRNPIIGPVIRSFPAGNSPVKINADHSRSRGEVREWLKRAASKAAIPERVSGVQIPPSPPCTIIFLHLAAFLSILLSIESKGRDSSPTGDSECQSPSVTVTLAA